MDKRIIKAIISPRYLGSVLLHRLSKIITSDALYLKLEYYFQMGRKLNLKTPQSYNEKLQWLKIHNRRFEYTKLVDKFAVKEYVAEILGKEYVFPTIGVWNNFDDIDFDALPNQFVLKCTHDSGGLIICKDKLKLDKKKSKKYITRCLRKNYFYGTREYPYKNVPPRIIAEPLMVDESGTELKDYKFFCFNGKVRMMFVATDRPLNTKFDFYDEKFNHLPFLQGHPNADKLIMRPEGFDQMIKLAEKLSEGMPHVRVDLYSINGKIYFGEMTFFHYSGFVPFYPEKWDYIIGDWLRLPKEA